jgi:serine/threonine-protein kinase
MDIDHNLLFAVLALQADLLDDSRFVEACALWAAHKQTPLPDLLVQRGWLTPEGRSDVERLLARKVAEHGGDARASLAEVTTDHVRRSLAGVADPDVLRTLDPPTPPAPPPALPSTTDHPPGSAGRYTLSRLHAQGGIGRVWVARDDRLGREVALKELRPERAANAAVRSRFLKEARVTGQLEHPGVVPVHELGTRPEDGQPFYTMRLVRGRTLSAAASSYHRKRGRGEAGPLELPELLGAFVSVCNAVAFAHSRGVIHRDLKPQNVVLGDYGEAVVLDWGLARLTGQAEGDADAPPLEEPLGDGSATAAGSVLGTPAYMAPEQAEGRLDLLDARTDVYGLGAVLYELLAGRPPFSGGDTTEVLRRVVHEPPDPPRAIAPGTPRALEAVCLKALAKRPRDRYASAGELADDVRRWLADEPVSAWREPWPARASRWARRHRTAVAAAVVFLASAAVALGASTAAVLREQRRTEEQRLLAEGHYQAAMRLATDLITIAEEGLPAVRQSETVRKRLLEAALPSYRELLRQRPGDAELLAWTSRLSRHTANLRRLLNEIQGAEEAYKESIRLGEELAAADPDDPSCRDRLAQTLRDYGVLQKRAGRLADAEAGLGRAVELAEAALAREPGHAGYRRGLGLALTDRAEVLFLLGRPAECDDSASRGAGLLRGLLDGPEPGKHPLDTVLLARALNLAAPARVDRGQGDRALAALAEASSRLRAALKRQDENNARHYLARTLLEQGRVQLGIPGSLDRAGKALETAIRLWEDLVNRFPLLPAYREWLALGMEARGRLGTARKDPAAGADFKRAREALEKLAREFPEVPGYRASLARCWQGEALLAEAQGDRGRAAECLGRAAEQLRKAQTMDPANAQDRELLRRVEAALGKGR